MNDDQKLLQWRREVALVARGVLSNTGNMKRDVYGDYNLTNAEIQRYIAHYVSGHAIAKIMSLAGAMKKQLYSRTKKITERGYVFNDTTLEKLRSELQWAEEKNDE